MQQIIIKKDLEQGKLNALLNLLRSWDIDVELKTNDIKVKDESNFTLSAGLWKDYDLDASKLREKAWDRDK